MPKQKQDKQSESPISFRPSRETRLQLNNLMDFWEESQSVAISRCIERCWNNLINLTTIKEE